jgi:hypothetical protein
LGQDERLTAWGVQGFQEVEEGHALVEAGQPARLGAFGGRLPVVRIGYTRPGRRRAEAVGHRTAGDRQQPTAGAGARGEARQGGQRTQERLLGEVVGAVHIAAEVGHETPYVPVGGQHEPLDRVRVAGSGGQRPEGHPFVVVCLEQGRSHRKWSFGEGNRGVRRAAYGTHA